MEFIELGWGEHEDIIKKVPKNTPFVLIRDDDAARAGAPPYWAVLGEDIDAVEAQYEADGGTVSYITIVKNWRIK